MTPEAGTTSSPRESTTRRRTVEFVNEDVSGYLLDHEAKFQIPMSKPRANPKPEIQRSETAVLIIPLLCFGVVSDFVLGIRTQSALSA